MNNPKFDIDDDVVFIGDPEKRPHMILDYEWAGSEYVYGITGAGWVSEELLEPHVSMEELHERVSVLSSI